MKNQQIIIYNLSLWYSFPHPMHSKSHLGRSLQSWMWACIYTRSTISIQPLEQQLNFEMKYYVTSRVGRFGAEKPQKKHSWTLELLSAGWSCKWKYIVLVQLSKNCKEKLTITFVLSKSPSSCICLADIRTMSWSKSSRLLLFCCLHMYTGR